MGWRPENWKNDYSENEGAALTASMETSPYKIFEAGADAILKEYTKSEEFREAACEYCRELGWREPR